MPGLNSIAYAVARNMLIGGHVRFYASENYDPRVMSGLINQSNLVTYEQKPLNGISKLRTPGLSARKVPDITRYNRSGFVRSSGFWVTTDMDFFESSALGSADGSIIDPSIVERVYYAESIAAGSGNFIGGMEYLLDHAVAGMKAVFSISLNNFFPHIYADIRRKGDYDGLPASGMALTFATDTINPSATQVVDLSTLPAAFDDLANLGESLRMELRKLVSPLIDNDPHQIPRVCIPSSVWEKYAIVLEAYKSKYGTRRRMDDVSSSGSLSYVQLHRIDLDGFMIVKFPDAAIPRDTTANPNVWRAMALTPNAIVHGVNSVPIVGSTDADIDAGGYDKASIVEKMESLDQFYDMLGESSATGLRNLLNMKGADRDVVNNVMNKALGESTIYNYIRTTMERLPMGTQDWAKHYYFNSTIGESTLRANPYCMREWRIPANLVLLATEMEQAGFQQARSTTKTGAPV